MPHPRRAAALTLGLLAAGLSACSVSSPLTIASSGAALAETRAIAIEEADEADTTRSQFADALASAFAQRAIAADPEARTLADFSLAMRDAEQGVLRGNGSEGANEGEDAEQDWIAAPRKARRFDECEAKQLRGTLVLLDRVTGTVVYRGSGEATECQFGEAQIADLAERLVADALRTQAD